MRTLRHENQDFTFSSVTGAKQTKKKDSNNSILLPLFILEVIIVLVEIKYFLDV